MIPSLLDLETSALEALAAAAQRGELDAPTALNLQPYVPAALLDDLVKEINVARAQGLTSAGLAMLLTTLVRDRERRAVSRPKVDLVWSGPDLAGDFTRDTRVVVHELFGKAQKRVIVSTYALYQGQDLFAPLHKAMTIHPGMKVALFLDIARGDKDLPEAQLLAQFREKFQKEHWPWQPLPEVYYDPRSLEKPGSPKRACLHAKIVVIDDKEVFLTSANLTEAAQQRNIETGVLLKSPAIAAQLTEHFESLVIEGHLRLLKS